MTQIRSFSPDFRTFPDYRRKRLRPVEGLRKKIESEKRREKSGGVVARHRIVARRADNWPESAKLPRQPARDFLSEPICANSYPPAPTSWSGFAVCHFAVSVPFPSLHYSITPLCPRLPTCPDLSRHPSIFGIRISCFHSTSGFLHRGRLVRPLSRAGSDRRPSGAPRLPAYGGAAGDQGSCNGQFLVTLNGPVANNTTFKWWDLIG